MILQTGFRRFRCGDVLVLRSCILGRIVGSPGTGSSKNYDDFPSVESYKDRYKLVSNTIIFLKTYLKYQVIILLKCHYNPYNVNHCYLLSNFVHPNRLICRKTLVVYKVSDPIMIFHPSSS